MIPAMKIRDLYVTKFCQTRFNERCQVNGCQLVLSLGVELFLLKLFTSACFLVREELLLN